MRSVQKNPHKDAHHQYPISLISNIPSLPSSPLSISSASHHQAPIENTIIASQSWWCRQNDPTSITVLAFRRKAQSDDDELSSIGDG
jgi:hypothetical protein